MTNEEAITVLKQHHMWTGEPEEIIDVRKENKALEMAIKALERESSEDAISRQTVLDYIYNDLGLDDEENGKDIERQMELESSYKYIKSLPPVKAESKTGHWIDTGSGQMCSSCGEIQYGYDSFRRFCASCGIRMVASQKSEDTK